MADIIAGNLSPFLASTWTACPRLNHLFSKKSFPSTILMSRSSAADDDDDDVNDVWIVGDDDRMLERSPMEELDLLICCNVEKKND